MKDERIVHLWHFLMRTGMYVGKVSPEKIIVYLYAYNFGAKGGADLVNPMVRVLEDEHKIEVCAKGITNQIHRYAALREKLWISSFKEIATNILVKEFDKNGKEDDKKDCLNLLRNRVIALFTNVHLKIPKHWFEDWFGFCQMEQVWFQELWEDNEFEILGRIVAEVESIYQTGGKFEEKRRSIELHRMVNELNNCIQNNQQAKK